MRCIPVICAVWLCTSLLPADDALEQFLERHCLRCHGPQKVERDLQIDLLSRDFNSAKDSHLWAEILERINAGEMPPQEEPQPSEDEIATASQLLNSRLREGRAVRMAQRAGISHYRLSRQEYQNTVYDLLGVRYDPAQPGQLNADTLWQGYERIGSQLSLSPSHIERYYRAAEIVLSRALPATAVTAQKVRRTAADLRYNGGQQQQKYLHRFGIDRPLRALIFPGRLMQAFRSHWMGPAGPEKSGLYRARMQVSGIRPPYGQTPHLRIGKAQAEAANEGLVEVDVFGSEDEPQVIEFEVFLEMPAELDFNVVVTDIINRDKGGHHRNILGSDSYIFTHTSETRLLNPTGPKLFDEQGNGIFSFVLLDWIEWEGPLETESERSRRDVIRPTDNLTQAQRQQQLLEFATLAWRRPVSPTELTPYLAAFEAEIAAGESADSAWQVALLGVLTSRNFLYIVEGSEEPRDELNDWELASRLSYLLWSSMPDGTLFQRAEQGELHGDVLAAEVDRMLADTRTDRFVQDFSRQWLQLHRLGMFPPDEKLYPQYDLWLESSMQQEVIEYFREVFRANLSIDEFLDSNWTMANPRLCEFYGLEPTDTASFRRVNLPLQTHRGGLLTTGAILGLTSDGTRHRPVHRGVWLSETILGRTPPPPPANVDPIEPNAADAVKVTIRDRIRAHANSPNCAACHRTIDPLGLAFDEFDAIGQWRTHERVESGQGADPPVDPSGELPDGRTFRNAAEFRRLLVDDHDRFLRAFVEHLSTYALRRVLTVDDQDHIDDIVQSAAMQGFRLRDIVRTVALSDLLRKR